MDQGKHTEVYVMDFLAEVSSTLEWIAGDATIEKTFSDLK